MREEFDILAQLLQPELACLGNVYDWAGQERSVNLARSGFHFAAAAQVPRLLEVFERDCLARFTPCHLENAAAIEAIAAAL